jgi:hypothetical protein|tara:strand:- start:933 stop:1160 length:228 start_codon:yes stop_codon:yes gene_type:complete
MTLSFRKLLLRVTFRFLTRGNKLFAPLVFFGWIISFLRWLLRRERKSNSLIEDIGAGENISISHLKRRDDSDLDG